MPYCVLSGFGERVHAGRTLAVKLKQRREEKKSTCLSLLYICAKFPCC